MSAEDGNDAKLARNKTKAENGGVEGWMRTEGRKEKRRKRARAAGGNETKEGKRERLTFVSATSNQQENILQWINQT